MPKTIVTRSATGLDCASRRLRSGHYSKSIVVHCCCPETLEDHLTLFTDQMNHITTHFFEPFFNAPMDVDLKKTYCDINDFFDQQRITYANEPNVLTQIDFITNAMRLVRTEASQYFLKSLQFEALAREIETSIQGLLMHIYMLNTRVAILSGYTGDDALEGQTSLEVKQIKDPRYAVAKYQPRLSMLQFLYPDEPTGKYYSKLKTLLSMSGMYSSDSEVTDDMVKFLDRYLVKHNLHKTLEQWLAEKQAEEIDNDCIEDYTGIIDSDKQHVELIEGWREIYGNGVINGQLTMNVRNIDQHLSNIYAGNLAYLKRRFPDPAPCPPSGFTGSGMHPWQSPLGRMIPLDGTFSINPLNNISFNIDDLTTLTGSVEQAQKTLNKLYARIQHIPEIKKNITSYSPPVFKSCSQTRKKCKKTKNNCTRKNICS